VTRPFVERLHRLTRGGAYVFMSDALDGSAGLVDSVYFSHDREREFGEQVCISTNAAGEILRFHNAPSNRTEVNGLRRKPGMAQALRMAGLPLEGRHHRREDDAWNIAALVLDLLSRGAWPVTAPAADV
jgi:hypothetical protein